jgi:hypothetical protein
MNASQVASRQRGSASAVPLGKVVLEEYGEMTLELPLASAGPVGQLEPSRELAQELEQPQVGPSGRLDPVGLGLGDGDRCAGDRCSERWLELPEARLPLTMPLR